MRSKLGPRSRSRVNNHADRQGQDSFDGENVMWSRNILTERLGLEWLHRAMGAVRLVVLRNGNHPVKKCCVNGQCGGDVVEVVANGSHEPSAPSRIMPVIAV